MWKLTTLPGLIISHYDSVENEPKNSTSHVRESNHWKIEEFDTDMKEDLSGVNAATNHQTSLIIHMRNTFGVNEHKLTSSNSLPSTKPRASASQPVGVAIRNRR